VQKTSLIGKNGKALIRILKVERGCLEGRGKIVIWGEKEWLDP